LAIFVGQYYVPFAFVFSFIAPCRWHTGAGVGVQLTALVQTPPTDVVAGFV